MTCYVVAYDLNSQGQNYSCITNKLEALSNCKSQQSVWFVEYSGTAVDLRDHLMTCLDENDRLFVSEVSKGWAGKHMPVCGKWLNDRGY